MSRFITKDRIGYLYKEFILKMFADEDRKPIYTQLAELMQLTIKTRFWPHNYFKYQGYKSTVSLESIEKYVPGLLFTEFRKRVLNDYRYAIFADDKYCFHKLMFEKGIPTAHLYGVLRIKNGNPEIIGTATPASDFLSNIKADGIVIKPVIDSNQGAGVTVIDIEGEQENKFMLKDEKLTASELITIVSEGIVNSDYLIENKLIQHESIEQFYPLSVNTIRVDTLLSTTGVVIINSAYLRIGRNGRRVDNWSGKQGGIGININVKSGELSEYGIDYSLIKYNCHPTSEKLFSGFIIPFWNEIVEIVSRAAIEFPRLKSQGWDIAITENGPVIIEVNQDYDVLAQQTCTQAFGENEQMRLALKSYAEESKVQQYLRMF